MLRPVRSLPPKGLSTVGFDAKDLSRRRDPATRRSDAYRGGTRTHWKGAASPRPSDGSEIVGVTTHHGHSLTTTVSVSDAGDSPRVGASRP